MGQYVCIIQNISLVIHKLKQWWLNLQKNWWDFFFVCVFYNVFFSSCIRTELYFLRKFLIFGDLRCHWQWWLITFICYNTQKRSSQKNNKFSLPLIKKRKKFLKNLEFPNSKPKFSKFINIGGGHSPTPITPHGDAFVEKHVVIYDKSTLIIKKRTSLQELFCCGEFGLLSVDIFNRRY